MKDIYKVSKENILNLFFYLTERQTFLTFPFRLDFDFVNIKRNMFLNLKHITITLTYL